MRKQNSNRPVFWLRGPFFLLVVVGIGLFSFTDCESRVKSTVKTAKTPVFNIKEFGAKGDGVTNDYGALQLAAEAVCKSPGATLVFPKGTYLIDEYRITGGPNKNPVQNIRYVGCSATTIRGINAKIEVKGDFRRTADYKDGNDKASYETSVIPFEMVNSFDFQITGFELAGNIEKTTRDAGVLGGIAAGILTTNCHGYSIEDVFVHGFSGDGILLGANSDLADQQVRLVRVRSTHNARQGLGILQVRQAEIVDSVFSDNGRTGAYGSHVPAAGVTIEPIRFPPKEDLYTGLITFNRCRFEENVGSQFISSRSEAVDSLTVENSYVKSTLPDTAVTAFMSVAKVALVTGNSFDVASGRTVALAAYRPDQYPSMNNLAYSKNVFKLGDNKGITAPLQPAPVELIGNKFIINSSTPDRTLLRLDYVKTCENNSFFEANSGYSGMHYAILYEKGNTVIRNNRYDTDRNAPGFFEVYYGPQVAASGDIFPHPANFQPYYVNASRQRH